MKVIIIIQIKFITIEAEEFFFLKIKLQKIKN